MLPVELSRHKDVGVCYFSHLHPLSTVRRSHLLQHAVHGQCQSDLVGLAVLENFENEQNTSVNRPGLLAEHKAVLLPCLVYRVLPSAWHSAQFPPCSRPLTPLTSFCQTTGDSLWPWFKGSADLQEKNWEVSSSDHINIVFSRRAYPRECVRPS